jgi:phosphoglycolate phosphatase-like HAD superfamily hydrolase
LGADQVFVVGDTPHDIASATSAGAVAVGVASGHYTIDELKEAGAVHLLRSLEESFPGCD